MSVVVLNIKFRRVFIATSKIKNSWVTHSYTKFKMLTKPFLFAVRVCSLYVAITLLGFCLPLKFSSSLCERHTIQHSSSFHCFVHYVSYYSKYHCSIPFIYINIYNMVCLKSSSFPHDHPPAPAPLISPVTHSVAGIAQPPWYI